MSARSSAAVALATIVAALAGCGAAGATKPVVKAPQPPATRVPTGPIPAAVHSDQGLALVLLHQLGRGAGNVVFSPYSIESALSMVEAGAMGLTKLEIDHVLQTAHPATVAAGLKAIGARLAGGPKGPSVEIANSLWVQSGLSLRKPFTRTLATLFGAAPQPVDFAGAPETARQAINAWVAARTGQKITDLFPAGTITSQTALVLANAIYLVAHWRYPFTHALTAPGPFYPAAGPTAQVPFMTQTPVALAYAHRAGYQAIDLPYTHSTLSMLLVMPTPGTLARFEQRLTPKSFSNIVRSLSSRRVDLHVPKFHLTFDTGLGPVLAAVGMPVAFTDAADFSAITSQVPLKISAVEHAADLQVDEAGTVAAAATGIGLEPTAVTPTPATSLILNHPFLALLRDDASGAILVVAQVTNPS